MRGVVLAVLVLACASSMAGLPGEEATPDVVGLRSISGWLKAHGTEGFLGADVAKALGIGEAPLEARQRGFRNASVLRVAQLLPDASVLFMVQGTAGEVYFYHSTPKRGLVRALVSVPGRALVLPMGRTEAEDGFHAEILYWEDKAANR
jgi:hypothetical protein